MRRCGQWGGLLAVALWGLAMTQVSEGAATVLTGNGDIATWQPSEVPLADLPIEQDRGVSLVHGCHRPIHGHYGGGFGGSHYRISRPARYNMYYFGVPNCSQQWGMYYSPRAFPHTHSFYRAYYGGYGGGCHSHW